MTKHPDFTPPVERVIRDGKVAVAVSYDCGAGWSSWSDFAEAAVFSPDVVAWVEAGKPRELAEALADKYGNIEHGLLHDLHIEWVPIGTRFSIHQTDGYENLITYGPESTDYTA